VLEVPNEAALSNPGVAAKEDNRALTGCRPVEPVEEQAKWGLASNRRGAQHR
jgi:hypothetical protein